MENEGELQSLINRIVEESGKIRRKRENGHDGQYREDGGATCGTQVS